MYTDEEINKENQRTQLFFKSDMYYIIDYILKHKYELINDRRYLTKDPDPQYVSEPNELYRIILTTENDIESILKGLLSNIENDSFKNFSYVVQDIIFRLIEKMHGEKYDGEEKISNDEWYFIDSDDDYGRDSLHTLHEFDDSSYFRPNTVCARMVIKWIALYMIVQKTNSIASMEDIVEFSFTYDEYTKAMRLFIWTKDKPRPLQFLYKQPYLNNVLNVINWEPVWSDVVKEKDKDILESFGLPLSTIVSEIKSLYANYQTIIINNANPNDFTNEINNVFKIRIKDFTDIRDNVRYLVNCNSDIPDNHLFKKFAKDIKQIINKIVSVDSFYKWFFETRTGKVEDDVSNNMNKPDYSYYKPNIEEARIAITWVILYKLCKYYKLDRTKIYSFVIYYYPKADYLRIKITIDGKDHSYLLSHAKENNILDVDKWEECTHNFCLVTMEDDDIDKVEEKKEDTKHEELKETQVYDQQLMYVHNKKEKDQRMKKLLKLMIISQMMNSQK